MSNNNKASAAVLVLVVVSLQAPLLIYLDYHVYLPAQNFVIGEQFALIPSVYGICNVSLRGSITYSGK